jgi:hypothetical protein
LSEIGNQIDKRALGNTFHRTGGSGIEGMHSGTTIFGIPLSKIFGGGGGGHSTNSAGLNPAAARIHNEITLKIDGKVAAKVVDDQHAHKRARK